MGENQSYDVVDHEGEREQHNEDEEMGEMGLLLSQQFNFTYNTYILWQ
jgi:hypothetical protein